MSESLRTAGEFDLLEATITSMGSGQSVDIKSLTNYFDIIENVFSTHLYGSIKVTDSTSILRKLPITGKELLTIRTKDFFGNEVTDVFFVYAMTDYGLVSEQDTNLASYTLHFCSREKFISDTNYVQKAYRNEIHGQVANIYNEFIAANEGGELNSSAKGFKQLVAQETSNKSTYVIPKYRPDDAIRFLAKRAKSDITPMQTYMYWETRDNYYFMTPQGSFATYANDFDRRIPSYYYNMAYNTAASEQDYMMSQIMSLNLNASFDTMGALKNGGYVNTVHELDFLNRSFIETIYDHADEIENTQNGMMPGNAKTYLRHDTNFVDQYLSSGPVTLVLKDYNSPGVAQESNSPSGAIRETQYYNELITKNQTNVFNLEENCVNLTVRGAFNLRAGGFINLVIPEFAVESTTQIYENEFYSGIYMLLAVTHRYEENNYYADCIASRAGLGSDPNQTSTRNRRVIDNNLSTYINIGDERLVDGINIRRGDN